MPNIRAILVISIFLTLKSSIGFQDKQNTLYQKRFPPCRACKIYVESFKKGLERTSKGKFEGGDTAWEEANLGSYATSEIRLTEIQDGICSEIVEGRDQCYALNSDLDTEIETWWFKKQNQEPDLYQYMCIDTVKQCCPQYHYGPNCDPCDGQPDRICNGNGKCKGEGTRKGNGKCACDEGYGGDTCDNCAKGFHVSYKDEKKLLCSKCHLSCNGECNKAGPEGCVSCKAGWAMDVHRGCLDVNECAVSKNTCKSNEFCVNNEGSFKCLKCDRSCTGCTGDGPDMCLQCAKGYILKDNMCVDAEQESRKQHVNITRYLTYFGLCVATCIVLNKSTYLAALIGLCVAIYIALSEYVLNIPPTPQLNTIGEDLMKDL